MLHYRYSNEMCAIEFSTSIKYENQLPLKHITYINIQSPVTTVSCKNTMTFDTLLNSHMPQCEITCLQELSTGQYAVQQFHAPYHHLFPVTNEIVTSSNIAPSEEDVAAIFQPKDISPEKAFKSSNSSTVMSILQQMTQAKQNDDDFPPPSIASNVPLPHEISSTTNSTSLNSSQSAPPPVTTFSIFTNPNQIPTSAFPDFALKKSIDNENKEEAIKTVTQTSDVTPKPSNIAPTATPATTSSATSTSGKGKDALLSVLKINKSADNGNTTTPTTEAKVELTSEKTPGILNKHPIETQNKPSSTKDKDSVSNPPILTTPTAMSIKKIPESLSSTMKTPTTTSVPINTAASVTSKSSSDRSTLDWDAASTLITESNNIEEKKQKSENATNVMGTKVNVSSLFSAASNSNKSAVHSVIESVDTEKTNVSNVLPVNGDKHSTSQNVSNITAKNLQDMKTSIVNEILGGMEQRQKRYINEVLDDQTKAAVARMLNSDLWREEVINDYFIIY
jgi:hypothetical protein